MNIHNLFVPTDILTLFLIKLRPIDYVNLLKTCKTFYRLKSNKTFYLTKQLDFARTLVRCEYGPIYLIKKYNDIELLKFYLANLTPSEPHQFDCKNNKILYSFLINNYVNCIFDLSQTIYDFDDVDAYYKYNDKIHKRSNPFSHGCPPKICQSLSPNFENRSKRQRTSYNVLTNNNIIQLLKNSNIKLLDYCYQQQLESIKAIIASGSRLFNFPVSSLQWLESKNLIPIKLTVDPTWGINVDAFEYLLKNYKFDFNPNILLRPDIGYAWLSCYPDTPIKIILSEYHSFNTKEQLDYLQFLLYHLHPNEIPKRVNVKSCSFAFYCFCLYNKIEVKTRKIKYNAFVGNETIIAKALELLSTSYDGSLLKELYFLGYRLKYCVYNFNKTDLPRLMKILPTYDTEQIIALLVFADDELLDALIQSDSIKNLSPIECTTIMSGKQFTYANRVQKILIRLNKLNIFYLYVNIKELEQKTGLACDKLTTFIDILKNNNKNGMVSFCKQNFTNSAQARILHKQIMDYYENELLSKNNITFPCDFD